MRCRCSGPTMTPCWSLTRRVARSTWNGKGACHFQPTLPATLPITIKHHHHRAPQAATAGKPPVLPQKREPAMPVPALSAALKVPGDWAPSAYRTVAQELTSALDLGPSGPEVIDSLVHLHFSVYAQAEKLRKRQGRALKLGPRSFLDFIHQYVGLSNEKREGLEEEQRHLNVGLDKLRETVSAVSELQKSLAVKRTQLEAKNAEANEKLQRMVADQKAAEEQKAASIQIQGNLEIQEREISQRREVVMGDLADAEPAVQEAQASVSNIKKQHLTEVRSMGNPPAPVKNAMESVCIALGHKVDSWKTVQGIIRRDDFIASIVNFDTDRQMTKQVREKMKRDYLSQAGYNYETINRASKACGPLAKWVIAQVRFSEILDRVGPLRDEVDSLETQAQETKDQASTIVEMIGELEASIGQYKDEYAALISESQAIKSEMERVQTRVDRSIQLLDSLGSEKERWEAGSRTFDTQMSTIVGDALLSAAFLTYAGFFDQQYRESMWWLTCKQQISTSKPSSRLPTICPPQMSVWAGNHDPCQPTIFARKTQSCSSVSSVSPSSLTRLAKRRPFSPTNTAIAS